MKNFRDAIFKIKKIEIIWKAFNRHLVSDGNDDPIMIITDQTQTFVDTFRFSTNSCTMSLNSSKMVTDGTRLHNQQKSNLCVAYALTTAFREALKNLAISEEQLLSKQINNKKAGIYIPYGWTPTDVLDNPYTNKPHSKEAKIFNIASFESMLHGFLNCVR